MKSSHSITSRVERRALAMFFLLLAAPACTDEGEPTTGAGGSTSTSTSGGAGGSGGDISTGGSGGDTSTGGTGGASSCLPASAYAALFTLGAPDLCAVAVYTAAGTINYQQPTWGSHGGPLLVTAGAQDGEVTISRWTPPAGAQGAMTIADETVDAGIPAGTFVGGAAIDLGFRPGTAVSYSGAFPDTEGELVIVDGADTSERYPVNALFSMALLPTGQSGRLVHTGYSPLGDDALGPNGLYAADDCMKTFDPSADPSCADPIQVAAWGDASGPAGADTQGNLFSVMTSFGGDQVCRGFAASTIAQGAAATDGDVLFSLPGFGLGLAAIAPLAAAPGILAFQPSDAATFEALNVLQIRVTVAGDVVTAAAPSELLALATPNTAVAMLTDPEDRLWVGVPDGAGTTFVVLARK
jgi:hypothetical protein